LGVYHTYKDEVKAIFKLSIPIMIAQVGTVLMGLSNSVMIAKIGTQSLAASGIANIVYILFIVFGMGILSCVAPMVSNAFASENKERLGSLFRSSVEVAFLTSLVLTAAMFIVAENFEHFPISQDIAPLAKDYMRVLAITTFPYMLFMATKQFSDGLTHTKPAVYFTAIGVVVNIFLNWVFIYGKFNIPQMGIMGSGFATFIARMVMLILMLGYLLVNSNLRKFIPPLSANINTGKNIIRIFKLGIPAGMQLFFEIGAFTTAAFFVAKLGSTESAAYQIGYSLASISTMLAIGISVAGSIRVAKAVGEKNIELIKKTGISAFISAAMIMLICCIIFIVFKIELVYIYNKHDQKLIQVASQILLIVGFFQISDGLQVTALGVLRGVSDVNIPTVITLVAYWAIAIPVGYLLGFTMGYGVDGIWYGLLIGLSVSALLLVLRFYYLMKPEKINQVINQ